MTSVSRGLVSPRAACSGRSGRAKRVVMAAPTLPPTTVLEAFDTVALAAGRASTPARSLRQRPWRRSCGGSTPRARLPPPGAISTCPSARSGSRLEPPARNARRSRGRPSTPSSGSSRASASPGATLAALEALAPRAARRGAQGGARRLRALPHGHREAPRVVYARRMLADETYTKVEPTVVGLREAFAAWRDALAAELLAGEEADALRAEVFAASARLDVAVRQARLLALAALTPLRELRDEPVVKDLRSKRKEKAGGRTKGRSPTPCSSAIPPTRGRRRRRSAPSSTVWSEARVALPRRLGRRRAVTSGSGAMGTPPASRRGLSRGTALAPERAWLSTVRSPLPPSSRPCSGPSPSSPAVQRTRAHTLTTSSWEGTLREEPEVTLLRGTQDRRT